MLLGAASLFMRTVGVSFQIVLSGRVGAEAMGLFSLMSGVYGFALTLATSGIHLGVTRVVVEAIGKGEDARVPLIMRRAALYAAGFGLLACTLLFSFAQPIGLHWLKDARTVTSLRLFGISLPLISLSSTFGGYFTAVRRPYKSAAVQVTEQGLKIGFTMYLLTTLVPAGIEGACSALVLGGVLAELSSFLMEFLLYLSDRRRHYPRRKGIDGRAEGRRLLGITLPIALAAYVRSGLVTLEHILIPDGLRRSGSSHASALVAYGSIQSMALPVILYPAAIISAFSGLLVPELAQSCVEDRPRRIRYMICRVWWLSMLFSVGIAGILICFSGELGELLYPGTDAGFYIRILAPLIPIMYIDTATDAMLKGIGEQVYSMNVNITDALLSVVLVYVLVPRFGIWGYIATVYFSESFNTVFSITRLLCIREIPVRLCKWVYKPLLSIVGATLLCRWLLSLTSSPTQASAGSVILHCTLSLSLYLLLLFLTGSFDREDLGWICSLFSGKARTEPSEKELAELPSLKSGIKRRTQK